VLFPHRVGARWLALLVVCVVAAGGVALGMQPAGASTFTVTATGRFAYTDDLGRLIGINGARVEMCNDDSITGCPTMSVGVTDANGFYSITGSGGDFFDGPDPLVKVTATGPSGFVQPGNFPPVDYCFASLSRSNAGNGTINFGTLTPSNTVGCNWPYSPTSPGTDGAWQLWNNVKEAWDFMRAQTLRNPGADVPPVKVVWPMSSTAYSNNQINVATNHAFREAAIFHEYGHHIMRNFAEAPAPNYNNGVCDTISLFNIGGHCFWRSENTPIAWTEGWPSYFAEVMTTSLAKNDTISSMFGCDPVVTTLCGSVEFPPQPSPDPNLANVEGTVAAILWDLVDGSTDNHDFDNSADALSIGFPAVWDVYMNRDPDPFTAHNKILNLDELWEGFAALRPLELNRLSAIYDENGITKPAADLAVTSASADKTTAAPGDTFTVSDTTSNVGAVRPGLGSATGYYLKSAQSGAMALIGARNVADLIPGASSASSVLVAVPASTAVPTTTTSTTRLMR
jgi:hypothetical protein